MQAAKEAMKDLIHPTRSPADASKKNALGDAQGRNIGHSKVRDSNASDGSTTWDASGRDASYRNTVDMPNNVHGETMRITRVDENFSDPWLSRSDRKSDTEVREIVNPAITKETIIEENREQTITAVDRELHQDHYQTRVQPIVDKQVMPEEHVHRQMPVEYKELKHHKEEEIRRALEEERSRFKSTREILPAKHTLEAAETVIGEHHHHHVYETVQPVIEREIIQRIVTHTTIPIHERIEKDPSFHPKTIQPVMTMEEFLRAGGTLEGRAERMDVFEGEPQVMENGGADQTHPNAWDARGHHVDTRGVDTSRPTQGVTTTTTTTKWTEGSMRSASPLTASERERITMGPAGRTRSPLASPGLHTAGRTSAI